MANIIVDSTPSELRFLTYDTYTVLLSQATTNAPTVNRVYQNTIGDIVWTRNAAGDYFANLTGAFPVEKTVCPPFDISGYVIIPMGGIGLFDYGYQMVRANDNQVSLAVYDKDYNLVDLSAVGNMTIFIEIRVYN